MKLEINLQDETVWLSVKQMRLLFDRDASNIKRHKINIFKEKKLVEKNNVQNLHIPLEHGVIESKIQTCELDFHNLNMIISVVY